jgi:RNA polymerase sigma factor (sigma-70 family)
MSEPSPQAQPLAETVRRVAESVVPPTDEQLWERVRADLRDLVALTELYRRWRSPLVILAYQCGVSRERAEELVNSAFVALLRRRERPRLAPMPCAFAYLRRCADRACWRASRADRRRATREVSGSDAVASAAGSREPDLLGRAELTAAVNAALAALSDRQRLTAELHYLFGWTEPQVAEAIGVKPSTVKEHLDRAREKLRESLAKWNPTAPTVGGMAVGSVLADAARSAALPPSRLTAAVNAILTKVAATGSRAKLSLVLAGILVLGGAATAGWVLTREPERAAAPPGMPETLQAKNLRIFHDEVKPKLVGPLASLTLGKDGRVKSLDARAFDTRLECVAVIEHGPPMAFVSTLNIRFDTHTRLGRLRLDLMSNGQWRDLDSRQPVYWVNPFTGERVVSKIPALNDLVPAFTAVKWDDPRTEGEATDSVATLGRAAQSYEGVWYVDGDATKPIRCSFESINRRMVLTHTDGTTFWQDVIDLTIGPDGRLRGISTNRDEGVMSTDGQRVDFPGIGHWWTRTPVR